MIEFLDSIDYLRCVSIFVEQAVCAVSIRNVLCGGCEFSARALCRRDTVASGVVWFKETQLLKICDFSAKVISIDGICCMYLDSVMRMCVIVDESSWYFA